MRKPWNDVAKPPKTSGKYLLCIALWGNRIDEELRIVVGYFNMNATKPWSHEFDYVTNKVISWAKLPAPPRNPKKARLT